MLVVTVLVWAAGISGQGTGTCDTGGIGLIFVTDRLLGWRQRKGMEKDDVAPGKKQTWEFLLALLLMAVACIGIYLFSNAGITVLSTGI